MTNWETNICWSFSVSLEKAEYIEIGFQRIPNKNFFIGICACFSLKFAYCYNGHMWLNSFTNFETRKNSKKHCFFSWEILDILFMHWFTDTLFLLLTNLIPFGILIWFGFHAYDYKQKIFSTLNSIWFFFFSLVLLCFVEEREKAQFE